jgi:hypothetical protein
MIAHACKVYGLSEKLFGIADARKRPQKAKSLIPAMVFFCGLMRVRSFNALEPKLATASFRRLLDMAGGTHEKICSIETVSRGLCLLRLGDVQELARSMIAKAERNKLFREGWIGALRYFAIDGWEPFSSYDRHCPACLTREVHKTQSDGTEYAVTQYFHRYVVAMLIDERLDLTLDMEPLLPSDRRPDQKDVHEGEQTAALRLLPRVKQTFHWLDVVVCDALYANGPFLTAADRAGLGALIIAKKAKDEPLKDALQLWGGRPPEKTEVVQRKMLDGRSAGTERHEFWDCKDLETLDTYKGKIRVVRAHVTKLDAQHQPIAEPATWCFLTTGKASRLSASQGLTVARGRWHIENTGFHQWTTCWKLSHVFVHHETGTPALFWLFFAAYNLLTLYLYTQVRAYGRDRGRDVTKTISNFIDQLADDLARLTASPWLDTS